MFVVLIINSPLKMQ